MYEYRAAYHSGAGRIGSEETIVATVRKCLALAALPDAPVPEYVDRERRGFEVSAPGELPK